MSLIVAIVLVAAAALVTLVLELASRRERDQLRTTTLRVVIPGLPTDLHGLRVAFITDLHVPRMYVPLPTLLQALEEWRPRVLLLGGDYAAGRLRLRHATELLRELTARWPVVAVSGNTDYYFGCDLDKLSELMTASGGALLRNQAWRTPVGASSLEVLGLDDPINSRSDPEAALAQAGPEAGVRLALAHSPAVWQDIARLGAHIALCGHAHGGQVRLPGREAFITHWNYPREMASGLFRVHAQPDPGFERVADHWAVLRAREPIVVPAAPPALMYVSRGLGVASPHWRVFCPPELVCIEFVPEEQYAERQEC